ncbi:MAG: hypothetical protein GEV00_19405 [Actinophytocola sp.]|nr:hypothetical protein [Actinophytocola sp.]
MPTPPEPQPSSSRRDAARLDEVFGQVLPETTSDERDHPSGHDADDSGDDWYLENRPPHH